MTDIFDGILARKLNISTPTFRRLDSTIDVIFWICVAVAAYFHSPTFFKENGFKIGLLIGFEALTYIVSFIKFKKEIATHAIASKIWTLILFATLIEVLATSQSNLLFNLSFYIGILTRLEIIGITIILKSWTTDVPTIFHAFQLRKGRNLKLNKWFNG